MDEVNGNNKTVKHLRIVLSRSATLVEILMSV